MHASRSYLLPLTGVVLAAALHSACSRSAASYPDRNAVVAAQAGWCDMLAKLQGAPGAWEHLAACKAAYPTSSPTYLRAMTSCFSRRVEAAGDEAPDRSQIIAECNDEVAVGIGADDSAARPVVAARCARMNRCERIQVAECQAAFAKLEAAQRAVFTTFYNGAGQQEIIDCLEGASCTDNEEAGREACYAPVAEELLWFPE